MVLLLFIVARISLLFLSACGENGEQQEANDISGDSASQEGPVRGEFKKYEYLPELSEPSFTIQEDNKVKFYDMNSSVLHNDL